MKRKLLEYLNSEYDILKDVLMQTKEILKSLNLDDPDSANRLLSGRKKNIEKANKYQEAVLNIFKRSSSDHVDGDNDFNLLKERVVNILEEIKKLDNSISEIISREYAESKKGFKKTKEFNKFKKGYSLERKSLPGLFDKKS